MSSIRKISKKLTAEAEYGVDGVKFIAIVGIREPKSVVRYSRTGRIRNRRRTKFQVVEKLFSCCAFIHKTILFRAVDSTHLQKAEQIQVQLSTKPMRLAIGSPSSPRLSVMQ